MNRFATAINCMDGRVQMPIIQYLKENYRVDYVDMITEPGPNRILSEKSELFDSILNRIDISINKHYSNIIAVIGHHDCAGNPIDENKQIEQIIQSIDNLKEHYNHLEIKIIGLWVDKNFEVKNNM